MLPEKMEGRALWFAAALYVLLYVVFWPPIITTMDESAYLNFAYVLRQGTFYSDVVGVPLPMFIEAAGHLTIKYPPGMSLYLAALSFLGWKLALGANLLVHLATFFTVARLLKVAGASSLFALFFLLHPTAVIYSRTIMSDPLGGLLVALAFLACVTKRPLVAGLVLGLAVLVKTANGMIFGLFALGMLLELSGAGKPRSLSALRPLVLFVLGAVPLMAVAFLYQRVVQEGGWAKYSGPGQFTLGYFAQHFPFYLVALLLVFPGMLLGVVLYRGPGRWPLLLSAAGVVGFYSAYYFLDETGSKVESFVIGQRFLLAVLPLLVVAYGAWLSQLRLAPLVRRVLPLAASVLFVGAGAIHWRHQSNLKKLVQVRNEVAAQVPESATLGCNVHVGKLLHPAWTGKRAFLFFAGGERTAGEVAQLRAALAKGPVAFACWSREYPAMNPDEAQLLQAVEAQFETRSLSTSLAGLQIRELVAERQETR